MAKKSISYSKIPRAGLANKILIWAYGYTFAHINNIKFYRSGFLSMHIGPILRGEKSKRFYSGYFKTRSLFHIINSIIIKFIYFNRIHSLQCDEVLYHIKCNNTFNIYQFNRVNYKKGPTYYLKEHRAVIKSAFYDLLKPQIINQSFFQKSPIVAAHIRRGDFAKSQSDSRKITVQTHTNYFIAAINKIREFSNRLLPVIVFSDGDFSELQDLFELEKVTLANENRDLLDLLLLSKSKILITSPGSTFSEWAAFISDGIIINRNYSLYGGIRDSETNSKKFEGNILEMNKHQEQLLIENLEELN